MRFILGLLLCLSLATCSLAQTDAAQLKHLDQMLLKLKQVDLMNHILPLLMTKEQIRQILPSVEKARQKVREAQKKEYEALKRFEIRLDAAHKKALENGVLPGRELLGEIMKMFVDHSIKRMLIAEDNTDAVVDAMKAALNEGQIKAATNDLNPKLFDPSLKPEQMKPEEKLRFFVKEILLDPAAYDVLVLLSKTGTPSPATSGGG
jgi:hypothetical protein